MSEYQKVINALTHFSSKEWINQYFDLVKSVFSELTIERGDPRLAMSLSVDGHMPVNLGQRYILHPNRDESIGCIVSLEFREKEVGGDVRFHFMRNKMKDAKYIRVPFAVNSNLPDVLRNACIQESNRILTRSKKSSFLKFHIPLLYDFATEPIVRSEILSDLKTLS